MKEVQYIVYNTAREVLHNFHTVKYMGQTVKYLVMTKRSKRWLYTYNSPAVKYQNQVNKPTEIFATIKKRKTDTAQDTGEVIN